MKFLSPEKAWIFRITHIDNVPWLLRHGLHCRASGAHDPDFIEIGNADLIPKRTDRAVPIPPGGTLSEYIPFYFNSHTPMLLNIRTGYNGVTPRKMADIAILTSSLRRVAAAGVPYVFTDRHAYLVTAQFFSDLDRLDQIDWQILQARDFRRDPEDPGKIERYQAEALIHRHLPIGALAGIACHGSAQKTQLQRAAGEANVEIPIIVKPEWYC
jgi:hypothetical protein